jgi:hypothetical protein
VVDLGDEILVARQDDDQQQRAGQRQIDEAEHAEDGVGLGAGYRGLCELQELLHALDEQDADAYG